jgi:glycosyltransferase involved in cell wall biosynthesis
MPSSKSMRICLAPRVSGVGGMVSFQHRLALGLAGRGFEVTYDLADLPYQAVLVIGGTRRLVGLWGAHRRGIPIVQRLDGMNWLHRRSLSGKLGGSLQHYMRAEYGNLLLTLIRSHLTDRIVYQSQFVRGWWERARGVVSAPNIVIYNGVDLELFTPKGLGQPPEDHCRILMVEGNLMGGYEQGVRAAIEAAEYLSAYNLPFHSSRVEVMIVGRVLPETRLACENFLQESGRSEKLSISWHGLTAADQVPQIDRSAHLLYSADINSACPNSVIEALACGLPVVAFDTGALPELVTEGAGRIVPFGGDPWRLDPPDVRGLAAACLEILNDIRRYRSGARQRAEEAFDAGKMVDAYVDVLLGGD